MLLGAALACGLAFACGSDDGKKVADAGEAGAAGSPEAGAPGVGGGDTEGPAGAAGDAPVGGGGEGGTAGAGVAAGAAGAEAGGAGGQAGEGAGGAPVNECVTEGSVTAMTINPEPIYYVCPGGLLQVPFSAEGADDSFTCCGVSTSNKPFYQSVEGEYESYRGNVLEMLVPEDAPLGYYAMQLTCAGTSNEVAFAVQVNEGAVPVVHSISAVITPNGNMEIDGENLSDVTYVSARRLSTGVWHECLFDEQDKTNTSITCNFGGDIVVSTSNDDYYIIEVYSQNCGHAADPPLFLVVNSDA